MKKLLLIAVLLLLGTAGYLYYQVKGPVVHAPEKSFLYVPTGTDMTGLKKLLTENGIIKNTFYFDKIRTLKRVHFVDVKPGRYRIKDKSSLLELIRQLKHGNQEPVKFTVSKLRTKQDLAGRIGRYLECDSSTAITYLLSNDSLKKWNLDTNIVMTNIIPDTYFINWNESFNTFMKRMVAEKNRFWDSTRLNKAAAKNLTPEQVYIIASIVEEETNKASDKGNIAGVYLNRYKSGMKLQADPTVKYALRDFGIKRVLFKHLQHPSDYNTYYSKGLPPGPICTPSQQTIDAVLDAPKNGYLFFVAKPDFSGYSNFAENYKQHMVFARAYQKALDSLIKSKAR